MPTTSSSDASRLEDLDIGLYSPADSVQALALEQKCVQGESFGLAFHRRTFHRRAENFAVHRIVRARLGDSLVGVAAAAVKPVELGGRASSAAFFFDARVLPGWRRRGLGQALFQELYRWVLPRSEICYSYVAADNRSGAGLGRRVEGRAAGGYSFLVYPVYRGLPVRERASLASAAEVHAEMKRASGPFDFYANPLDEGRTGPRVASWILRRGRETAGCSAWSNREILGEVVRRLPAHLRATRGLLKTWPLSRVNLPRVPEDGEQLRSWYLFDFYAGDPTLARDLIRQVAAEALERGIGWLYLPVVGRPPYLDALRRDAPPFFAPMIEYLLIAGPSGNHPMPHLSRLYVDVRDL